MPEISEELMEIYATLIKQAQELIQRMVEAEQTNKILPSVTQQVLKDFELLEVYMQTMYYGNIVKGDSNAAIAGLQTAIRAAFLYGYTYALQNNADDVKFTPLLGGLTRGIVQ